MVSLTARSFPDVREALTLSGEPAVALARRAMEMQRQFIVETRKAKEDDDVARQTPDHKRQESARLKASGGVQSVAETAGETSKSAHSNKVQGPDRLNIRV